MIQDVAFVSELMAERDALQAELAEAREDSERLDWLDKNGVAKLGWCRELRRSKSLRQAINEAKLLHP